MSNEELKQILNVRLSSVKPFELKLGGISKKEDVSVEMIGDNEESIIVIEKKLV